MNQLYISQNHFANIKKNLITKASVKKKCIKTR